MHASFTTCHLEHNCSWSLAEAVADVGWSWSEAIREGEMSTYGGPPYRQRMCVRVAEDALLLE
jgi:hypothetical protein